MSKNWKNNANWFHTSLSLSLKLPRPPHGLAALRAGADPHGADRLLGPPGEGRHPVNRRRCGRCRAAVHRAGVNRHGHSCVCVKRDDGGRGRSEGRVGDQKGELSVGRGHQLEPAEHLRGDSLRWAELGAHSGTADGQGGWELHVQRLSQVRLLGRGLLRVVQGHHLAHAVGQVVEEPRPHLGVHPLGGGQEAGDLVHALVESGSVFTQDGGICWERCCVGKERGHQWRISDFVTLSSASWWLHNVFSTHFYELTAHLHALQVPQVLHCHLQDVCFFQLGVSGALWKKTGRAKSIFKLHLRPNKYQWRRLEEDVKFVLTYIFFKCVQDECLELPEALVNSCSPAFFHDGFGWLQRINNST